MHEITLVLSGSDQSGKSAIADCIHDWLLQIGVHVRPDPSHAISPVSTRKLPTEGVAVTIVEAVSQDVSVPFAGDPTGGLSGGLDQ